MSERLSWMLTGALAACVIGLLLGARPAPKDLPPHVDPGTLIYGLQFDRPLDQIMPGIGPITPVKIIGNQGSWFLVETPGQPRGPQWLNFDQVLTYRTEQ